MPEIENKVAAPLPKAEVRVSAVTEEKVVATTMEKAAITADADRTRKVAALRAARQAGADVASDPLVEVRVTKMGNGKVSMGEHVNGLGDLTYDHGETPKLPQSIALELESRGYVEIQ